jgi:hypothetical protein
MRTWRELFSYKVDRLPQWTSLPAGTGLLGLHADHIQHRHGFGQFAALSTVVLANGCTLLEEFMQVIRQTRRHGRYKFIDWFHGTPWFVQA